MARPRTSGRRSSTASPSPRALRRRWAQHLATISMRLSIPPRRCAGQWQAPPELTRRLRQIGVVAKERGAELVSQLKTGQRLVSPEGDVWRWDGFVAA